MATPILDLSTLIERPKIVIDGQHYEIMSPEELSVLDHHRLGAQGRRLDELMGLDRLDDNEERELSDLLGSISDFIMVDVPTDVRLKLTDAQRMEISEVFTALPLRKHLTVMAEAMQVAEAKSIGGKRRRASNASTAVRRTGGSTKRQSRS